MSLYDSLDQAFKKALKSRDSLKTSTLRMVRAAIKNKEVDLHRKLEDPEILRLLSSEVKQRKDALELFRKGGRLDLAEKEECEVRILESFLPDSLSEKELSRHLDTIIAELGAVGPKDMGRVMKEAMNRLAGRVEGGRVNALVKSKLTR